MSRYIDAEILLDAMRHITLGETDVARSEMKIVHYICHMPHIADVRENVRGEWRDIQIGNWHGVECTACKIAHDKRDVPHKNGGIVAWDFCPDCGADMRGDI